MTDPAPTRRSARGRVPNKKYSTDAFEVLNILNSGSEAGDEPLPKQDTSEDEDFRSDAAADQSEVEDDVASGSDEISEGSGIVTPDEEFEDALSYASENDLPNVGAYPEPIRSLYRHTKRTGPRLGIKRKPGETLHSRGIPVSKGHGSKTDHLMYLLGTGPKDLLDFAKSREKWIEDVTLPTRNSAKRGTGGMMMPHNHRYEERHADPTANWDWYFRYGGKEAIARIQSSQKLDAHQGLQYLSKAPRHHSFLIGPYGNQRMHRLATSEVLSIASLWHHNIPGEILENGTQRPQNPKAGWLLNLGSKVKCLDWAPNHASETQYLAIATTYDQPSGARPHSAFEPSEQYLSTVQIWKFENSGEHHYGTTIGTDSTPHVVHTICTKWGAPKYFRWCPNPRASQEEVQKGQLFIGLLAGVWSDGYIRVLDVRLNSGYDLSDTYVKYEQPAFKSRPPSTICTCLAWLSATQLAAGCANGFVAIWDISEAFSLRAEVADLAIPNMNQQSGCQLSDHRPFFYHCLHQSYILSLSTAYPMHEHFLVSCSIDGYLRLTDIRNPQVDFVQSPRARTLSSAVDFHPQLQSFLWPDDNDFVRALPIRRFFSMVTVAKTEGHVMSIAAGKVHASVLAGCADGTVIVTNPMRKVIIRKAAQYQQVWFRHEWVHQPQGSNTVVPTDTGDTETAVINKKGTPREGVSRITEGYKVESLQLLKAKRGRAKLQDGNPYATIHEEESSITQVAWNPNLRYGGWAAAGMGCGLVRVEDIAI